MDTAIIEQTTVAEEAVTQVLRWRFQQLCRAGFEPEDAAVLATNTPATNRWRRLPSMESGRTGAAAVWTGKRLLVWGGRMALAGEDVTPPHGLAYDPRANRWSPLPPRRLCWDASIPPQSGRGTPCSSGAAQPATGDPSPTEPSSGQQLRKSLCTEPMPNAQDDRPRPSRFRPEFGE